jgi:flagellar biosynthesis/type III secretory pathway protein FliH
MESNVAKPSRSLIARCNQPAANPLDDMLGNIRAIQEVQVQSYKAGFADGEREGFEKGKREAKRLEAIHLAELDLASGASDL